MDFSRTRFSKALRTAAFISATVVIAGYASYRSLPYVRGPVLDIFQPVNGASISSSTVEVIGRAARINSLSLNGSQISMDEEGNFSEMIIIFPGLNVIAFDATDKFARISRLRIEVIGTKELPEPNEHRTESAQPRSEAEAETAE